MIDMSIDWQYAGDIDNHHPGQTKVNEAATLPLLSPPIGRAYHIYLAGFGMHLSPVDDMAENSIVLRTLEVEILRGEFL